VICCGKALAAGSRAVPRNNMSYDISLYEKSFLKRALEEKLGDWTGADAISDQAKETAIAAAESAGFVRREADAELAEYLAGRGLTITPEWLLDNDSVLVQLAVFNGVISFTIPYSSKADASVALSVSLAKRLAAECGLAFYDPQSREALLE
jgi:hypothetical protein